MNDVSGSGSTPEQKRKQLVELFLQRTLEDVEHMRRNVPQLIAADQAAWQELRFSAQRAAGMAKTLDAPFLLAVTSAIEVLGIELDRLGKEGG